MPAFRGRVSDDQAQDLVAYVRAFGPARAQVAETSRTEFETQFRQLEDQWQALHQQLDELAKQRKP